MDPTTRATLYVISINELPQDTQDKLLRQPVSYSRVGIRRTLDPEVLDLSERFPSRLHGDVVQVRWLNPDQEDSSYLLYNERQDRFYQTLGIGEEEVVPVEMGVFTDFHPRYWEGVIPEYGILANLFIDRPLTKDDLYVAPSDGGTTDLILPLRCDDQVYYIYVDRTDGKGVLDNFNTIELLVETLCRITKYYLRSIPDCPATPKESSLFVDWADVVGEFSDDE